MRFLRTHMFAISMIALGGILLVIPFSRDAISRGVFFLVKPVLFAGVSAAQSVNSFTSYIQTYTTLLDANSALKEKIVSLQEKLVDEDALTRKLNAAQKTALFIDPHTTDRIGTQVFATFYDPSGHVAAVDGGSDNGIQSGELVIARDRVFVGRVSEVHAGYSLIGSLDTPGTTFSVRIIPLSRASTTPSAAASYTEGIAIGKGDGLIIDLVPNAADVRPGDLVVTSGTDQGIVKDLLIGEVASAVKSTTRVFQDIRIVPIIPFSHLQTVFILRDHVQ